MTTAGSCGRASARTAACSKWCIERIEGKAAANEIAVGYVPTADQLDLAGVDADMTDIDAALAVDVEEWKAEIPLIEEWFAKIDERLPSSMRDELDAMALRLGM